MVRDILASILLGGVLLLSLLLNIGIHELAHYGVASHLGLSPEVYVDGNGMRALSFSFNAEPIIYTSYSGSSSLLQDRLIAFAGPFANLVFCFLVAGAYFLISKKNKSVFIQLIFIALLLPALLSAIANFLPFGQNDGRIIFGR
jgi:hypothetical protein